MPNLRSVEQIGMDERVVEDDELVGLLEKRLRLRDDASEVRKAAKAADEEAKAALAKYPLEDDQAIRVGRFRIAQRRVEGHAVSFETEGKSRLQIELWGEG